MAQQHLNDADVGAALQQMRGEGCAAQRMHRDPAWSGPPQRKPSGRPHATHLDVERLRLVTAGEQPMLRTRQTPIGPQDGEQLHEQHDAVVQVALPPLPCSTRMTIRPLSMSATLRLTASEARNPPHRPWSMRPASSGSLPPRESARLHRRSAQWAACAVRGA